MATGRTLGNGFFSLHPRLFRARVRIITQLLAEKENYNFEMLTKLDEKSEIRKRGPCRKNFGSNSAS